MAETDLAKRIDGLIKPCISVITKDSERYRDEWGSYLTFDFKPLKGDCVELVLGGARVKARAGVYHSLGVGFGAPDEEAGSDFDPDKPEEYASWRIWGLDCDPIHEVLTLDDRTLIKAAGKTSVSWLSFSLFDDGFQMPMVATNPANPLDLSETAFITLQTLIEGLQKQALEVVTTEPGGQGEYQIQNTQPVKPLAIYTKSLDRTYVNRSFVMKALKGFEEIAYGKDDGTYELPAKDGTNRKAVLSASVKACEKYIGNDGANWELAARIVAMVNELRRKPEAIAMQTDGRVWITTNTIVRELTRTAKGVNTNATRDESFRKLVVDALRALSSAQITSYGADGNLEFVGYVMQAEYVAQTTDNCGNRIKDVWGFSTDKDALSFAELVGESNVSVSLLDMKPMTMKNAWVVQALRGDILSEIRSKLYPKRGKGLKEYKAVRKWEDMFKSADVKANGNITPAKKERVVRDFQRQLIALDKFERHAANPIYLEARSTRDAQRGGGKGAWSTLEVTGHKNCKRSYKIDLDVSERKPKGEGEA